MFVVMCYDLLYFVMCFSLGQISLGIYSINRNCPLSLDGPESSTEWVVGKGIAIYFIPAAILLIPHYQASELEVLGEAAGPPCMLAMLIPHYRALEPEVLGEAVGCFADPTFLRLGA